MEIKTKKNLSIDQEKIVKLSNGYYRYVDSNTGFQSGHISKRNSGEWKNVFSPQEIKIIIEKLDTIAVELGYPSEKN